ncbi:hypothetical protein [Quatrionicoccus australiensis]|uniref:hypothetical protein n=1 Tax=Quatrionicoccus australiensis TaxID=138118 RepID=UPI001CFA6D6C|nr:hypothetical protein [Quatrionicoccus australiensis]MCB4360094.1 hypothetical protein [Quatrionicoccus australiensis]
MEYRSLSLAACLISLACLAAPALADQAVDPALEQDWKARLDKAAALQAEGKQRQAEAARVQALKDAECEHKFLVNSCLNESREEYMVVSRQARLLENEGKAIERQVKKEQLSEHDRQQRAEAPKRAAELQARQTETAALRDEAESREAAIRTDKERKAAEGARRKADDAAKQRRKQQEHAARVAEKMDKAARRAAEAPGQ